MPLNWNAHKETHPDLLSLTWKYKGKIQKPEMHPMLYRLIWLTMSIRTDLTKSQSDVMERISLLHKINPDLVTINYSDDADLVSMKHGDEWIPFLKYYPNACKTSNGWSVPIDADWVSRYWGLSTNSGYVPFKKWVLNHLSASNSK